ncbi:MAG TPA: T9SS type A sorting domain-containing protein [Lutibacter sp.]|nr:T9SS type A sorting domain-containing protein [Lutibacter sp.]
MKRATQILTHKEIPNSEHHVSHLKIKDNRHMKKNYTFYSKLLFIPLFAFVFLSLSGGRDGQYSGSPGDSGATCTTCHSGGSFGADATVTTNIPATGFIYGDTYQVTVSVASGATKHGFQLTTEDASNTKVGTYAAGTGSQIVNGGTHMTHTASGNTQNAWVFDWTAPAFAEGGEVTFYAAVNATNAQNNTSGDEVVTASRSFSHSSIGIEEFENISLRIYPNPTTEFVTIDSDNDLQKDVAITVSNTIGQTVLTSNTTERIDVKNLKSGVYFLQLKSANQIGTSRFIKK